MFFQEVSSVLLLDKYGNDMLCSMLFLSLGFDVLTDYFYRCSSCRQMAEALAPECFLPEFFPDSRILFFQQPATGTFIGIDKFTEFPYFFCSFWNWIIDNFSSIFYHHNQMIIHQIYWMCIVICFSIESVLFSNIYFIDWFYYTMNRIAEQVFFFIYNSSPTCRGRRILAIYYVKYKEKWLFDLRITS